MSDHTHKQFDAEMEEIRSGVLAMGGLVETQLTRAIDALKHPDNIDLIASVAADERAINQMQVSIDQQCSQIIAKRQPAAVDLRMVLTEVQVVNELERIGDEIKKIAYKAQQMQRPERLSNVRFHEITRAAELAESNLQLALDAFARLDVNAAAQVVSNDEAIDSAFLSILRQLISYMMEDPRTITPALEIVFIAKSIERIGDHAKNVAENVVHVVRGKDVRHATAEQIRAELAEGAWTSHAAVDPGRRRRAGDPGALARQSRGRRLRGAHGRGRGSGARRNQARPARPVAARLDASG